MKRWIRGVVVALLLLVLLAGTWRLHKSRTYQLFGELVRRVETPDSLVAITFDDGPTPGFTDEVLEILGRTGTPATFFVVGSSVEENPDQAAALVAAGHELGNHSYSHRTLVLKGPSSVRSEVVRTDSLIRAAGYTGEIHFRPPYGKKLFVLPWVLSRLCGTSNRSRLKRWRGTRFDSGSTCLNGSLRARSSCCTRSSRVGGPPWRRSLP
jgi:peptidoglycan/xylan/chitin deacetylase (PgdA/CDA1 family)